MSNEMTASVGFARPSGGGRPTSHRLVVLELVASLALVLSTLVTATVVTIGYAHAEAFDAVASADDRGFWLALLFALLFAGMGGLTALMARGRA
jgi:hypothetical protein